MKGDLSKDTVFELFEESYYREHNTVVGDAVAKKLKDLAYLIFIKTCNCEEICSQGLYDPILTRMQDECSYVTLFWRFSSNPYGDGKSWFPDKDLVYGVYQILKDENNMNHFD